jgi:hypothetical protein
MAKKNRKIINRVSAPVAKKAPEKHVWGDAVPFLQHAFQKTVALLSGLPRVLVTRAAYQKMLAIVDIADKEVGWLGTATRTANGDFLISEIFLFKQEVSSVTTEISPEGLAEVAQEILSTRPDGVEVLNNLRFWGHSHVRMGTSPSGQDESQMATFRDSGHPWMLRGICNKEGRMEFTIFLYESGIKVVDAEWQIYEPVDVDLREEIETEFNSKVSEMLPAFTPSTRFSNFSTGFRFDDERREL